MYTVINIIHLTASHKLTVDRLADDLAAVLHNEGLDRKPVYRRFLKYAHITDPDETHMKCPRDWCCRECEDIHIALHLLDLLFVGDAEALFLVHDQKT